MFYFLGLLFIIQTLLALVGFVLSYALFLIMGFGSVNPCHRQADLVDTGDPIGTPVPGEAVYQEQHIRLTSPSPPLI